MRFIVTGIVNTAFAFGCYALFLKLGLSYQIANLLALIIGIVFSFKMHARFVFREKDNRLIGRFALSWIFIYFLNIFTISQLLHIVSDAYLAGALAIPVSVIASFLLQKRFVFTK